METPLRQYAADHHFLLDAAREAGIADPVAVYLDEFYAPLIKAARRGRLLPVAGVLVRDWDPDNRRAEPGVQLGLRLYEVDGVRFARVCFQHDRNNFQGKVFTAVGRADYRRLYRIALRCRRDAEPPGAPPVLPAPQLEALWRNTIGYLDPTNLRRIREYGGRARRGVLLSGPPGNGKTMACRWLWEECRHRGWEWRRFVTPDAYRAARQSCDPEAEVKALFAVGRQGIVFFDDMDLALRDRDDSRETDDQAVFLGALDGLEVAEGVAFVFTTNCPVGRIDPAFRRPGRLDVVLHLGPPDAGLRRHLLSRWHADIRAALDLGAAVAATDGYSFAEIEELKNLLVLHFVDHSVWDWEGALEQFAVNRNELASRRGRVGFHLAERVVG